MKCFNCDQIRHYKNQYSEPVIADKGKVFALEPSSSIPTTVEKGKSVMEGTLLIHSISVRVLFDIGASHSFICQCLVNKLRLDISYLLTSLRVANPIGGYATLDMRSDQLELDLLGHKFTCSLYVYDFRGFRIILGMDWLDRNDARIFCLDGEISLRHANSRNQIIYSVEKSDSSACALLNAMEAEEELDWVLVAKECR